MLERWRFALAAAQHATSNNREKNSVTKGYGAQTREQHSKAMSQKALSVFGERLLHLHNDSQLLRSELNEFRRSLNGSGDNVNSQQALISGRDKLCEDDNSSFPKQRFTPHSFRPSRMAEFNTTRNSAGDVRVDSPSTSRLILQSTEDLEGSKNMVFEICRFPGSNFSAKLSTMGLLSARSTSSITPIVRSDLQVDNSLHILDKDRTTAIMPCHAFNTLHSLKEP